MRKIATAIFTLAFLSPIVSLSTVSTAIASIPVPICSYRQLEVAVAWGPGAAAGNIGIPFIIANISKSTCTLYGYPKLSFVPYRYKNHVLRAKPQRVE